MRKITRYFVRGTAAAALAAGFALGPMVTTAGAMRNDPCANYEARSRFAAEQWWYFDQTANWYVYQGRPDLAAGYRQMADYWHNEEMASNAMLMYYDC